MYAKYGDQIPNLIISHSFVFLNKIQYLFLSSLEKIDAWAGCLLAIEPAVYVFDPLD